MDRQPARQRTIDERIAETQRRRLVAAQFYLFKHLAGVSLYEQAMLTLVWLCVGTKYKSYDLDDVEVMDYCKCGRTTFFETLRSCHTRSFLFAEPVGSGRRRYRLCLENLVDGMPIAARRRYYEILGRSPREIDLLVPSAVRIANPSGERAVRQADAYKEYLQEGPCKNTSKTPPPPPQESSNPAQREPSDDWAAAVAAVCEAGVVDWETPIAKARERVEPEHVLELVEHWRRCGSMFDGPAALRGRIMRCHRSLDVPSGWPRPAEPSRRMADVVEFVQRAHRYAAGESEGEPDAERFEAWVIGQAGEKRQYTAAEVVEAIERSQVSGVRCQVSGVT